MILLDAVKNQVETRVLDFADTISSDVKIKKQALTALSSVAAIFALGLVSLTFIGTLSTTVSLLSLPFLCFSYVIYETADRLKNYDDPFELQLMKSQAVRMSFSDLIEDHEGIDPILEYKIVSLEMLRSKFLTECEGKTLSVIFEKTPLSYVRKYGLLSKEQIRNFFLIELRQESSVTSLCNRLGKFGLLELKRAEVIAPSEYEALERVHAEEEKIDKRCSSRLLEIDTQFFARREHLLSDLAKKEKKASDRIHHLQIQEKPVSLNELYGLQKRLKAIQIEKGRVQQDESLGRALQQEYEACQKEIHQEHQEKIQKLLKELDQIKNLF
jgi:hypothetical protein